MPKAKLKIDTNQINLFAAAEKLAEKQGEYFDIPTAGDYDIDTPLRNLISNALKNCPLSRHHVSAKMSELTGAEITKSMIDNWSAESKEAWRFPLCYLPAFELATSDRSITTYICKKLSGSFITGKDVFFQELGKLEVSRRKLSEKTRSLRSLLNSNAFNTDI